MLQAQSTTVAWRIKTGRFEVFLGESCKSMPLIEIPSADIENAKPHPRVFFLCKSDIKRLLAAFLNNVEQVFRRRFSQLLLFDVICTSGLG